MKNNWEEIFRDLNDKLPVVFKQKRYSKKTVIIVQTFYNGKAYVDKTNVANVLSTIFKVSEKFPELSGFRVLSNRGSILHVYKKPTSKSVGTGSSTGDCKLIENWNKISDKRKGVVIKLLEAQIAANFRDEPKKKKRR